VVVAAGHTVIVTGHDAVAGALEAGEALLECRLAAFEMEPIRGHRSALDWAEAAVTAAGLTAWEQDHGFRFASPPPWIR
jgi:hypothetical protein